MIRIFQQLRGYVLVTINDRIFVRLWLSLPIWRSFAIGTLRIGIWTRPLRIIQTICVYCLVVETKVGH